MNSYKIVFVKINNKWVLHRLIGDFVFPIEELSPTKYLKSEKEIDKGDN